MSATGRGSERSAHDFYGTPPWCVDRLLEACHLPSGRWLEPCVGEGAIVKRVDTWRRMRRQAPVLWTTIDVRPECKADVTADYAWFGGAQWRDQLGVTEFDVCLTNPPYAQAMDFVQMAVSHCRIVVMLLRLNWLASDGRADWLRANTPDVYVLPNRPSFTGEGTDATEYGWFVWGKGGGRIEVLARTPEEVRCAA